MLEYTRERFAETFEHPMLMLFFLIAAGFAAGGLLIDFAIGKPIAAGFGGVFAIISGVYGVLGYGALYTWKFISVARDESATYLSN